MNVKAQISTIDLVVFLFIFAIATLFAVYIYQAYFNSLDKDIMGDTAMNILESQTNTFKVLDYSYIFLVGGLLVSLFLSGYFLRTHPIFLIVSVVLGLVATFISATLTNVFYAIKDEMSATASQIPFTIQLASNFPLIALAGVALLIIGLYMKGGAEDQAGYY